MNDPRYSEIQICEMPPMRVVSYRAVSISPEGDASRRISEWMAAKQLPPLRTFGFDVEVAPEQQAAGLRGYELWAVAPEGVEPDGGMMAREFQGGLYAVMTIFDALDDPFARIPPGWEHLHNWVQANTQYEGAEHQMLEEVVTEKGAAGEPRHHLVIYYPIAQVAVGVPA